uniref:Tryptophan synthase alpha chain n=1 Tax=Lophosiphonia teges TaxID=2007110 RepID=A0A1Z1MUT5_9FLOR|nr:Tryptophan synthase alpha subunit [Polysiphonia teges]
MNTISKILQKKRDNSIRALIPFVTAGYPNIDLSIEAILMLDKRGADIIELGIPYSDALADGPLIQEASRTALNNGIYVDEVLCILDKLLFKVNAAIVIFTYYNPILVRGLNCFISEISQRGVKGLIIPDLPIEEMDYLIDLCKHFNIELILFIAPTSSKDRINNIISKAPGCVYLVSSTGVTGIRNFVSNDMITTSNYIASKTDKLLMLGFGISLPNHISNISKSNCTIDGIVVGSAFTRILAGYTSNNDLAIIEQLGYLCEKMKQATCS